MSDVGSLLLKHHRSPYHRGQPATYQVSGSISSSHCGDEIRLFATTAGPSTQEVWYVGQGCMVSQAAASILCHWSEGRTIEEILSTSPEAFLELLSVPLTPLRQQCALLPFRCLKQILADCPRSASRPERRALGTTGLVVSSLGYGTFKLGRNRQHRFSRSYELPSEPEVGRLLKQVLDAGIILIDTAPAYGLAEERIGRALGHRRNDFVLATKVGEEFTDRGSVYDYSSPAIRSSVERSLRRMRTDRLDIVTIHSNGADLDVLQQTDVVATLLDLKSNGHIHAIGFSGKTVAGARAALDWADVLMVTYNMLDHSHAAVIDEAARAGVGVIVKKGLASGRLPPATAIPFVLSRPDIASLVIGTLDYHHLLEDLSIAAEIGCQGRAMKRETE